MSCERRTQALHTLYKHELHAIVSALDLPGGWSRASKADLVQALAERDAGSLFGALTRDRVRDILGFMGLEKAGRKPELLARLVAWCQGVEEVEDGLDGPQSRMAELFAEAFTRALLLEIAVQRLGDEDVRTNWPAQRIAEVLVQYEEADLCQALYVDDLRHLLDARGLSTRGRKAELFDRMLAWAAEEEDDVEEEHHFSAVGPTPEAAPPRVPVGLHAVKAILIGNQGYEGADCLNNPAKDVRDLADLLRSLGHEATAYVDLGGRQMKKVLREFARGLAPDDGVLFYFSGHGLEHHGHNWLLPVDFGDVDPEELPDEAVDVERVLRMFGRQRFRVCILDACRYNSYRARMRGPGGEGLGAIDIPDAEGTEGTLICYATAPGKVAWDGKPGTNGTYTAALLAGLPVPGRRIEDVLKEVRRRVSEATGGKQVPWDHSSLTGDWYPAGGV